MAADPGNAIGTGIGLAAVPEARLGGRVCRQAWRFKGAKGFYVRPNRSLFALLAAEREEPLVLRPCACLDSVPAPALTERGAAT